MKKEKKKMKHLCPAKLFEPRAKVTPTLMICTLSGGMLPWWGMMAIGLLPP